MKRLAPVPVSGAIGRLAEDLAPRTPLTDIQRVWTAAVGEAIAAEASPTSERAGTVVVTCSSSVWAQELDLMSPALIEQLNGLLDGRSVKALRCQAAPPRR